MMIKMTKAMQKRVFRQEFDIRKLDPPAVVLREDDVAEELDGLAGSIEDLDLLNPLLITTRGKGKKYELIAGCRRVQCAKKKQRWFLPAWIYDELPNNITLIMSLTENVHRTDLAPIWEARAYRVMQDRDGLSLDEVAAAMRKPVSHVRSRLKLLGLDKTVQRMVQNNEIPATTAIVIADIPDKQTQCVFAEQVKDSQLSYPVVKQLVKEAEAEARRKEKLEKERQEKARAEDAKRRQEVASRKTRQIPEVEKPSRATITPPSPPSKPVSPVIPKPKEQPNVLPVAKQEAQLLTMVTTIKTFTDWLGRLRLDQFDAQHLKELRLIAYHLERDVNRFNRRLNT
jgi:ParB family transcriptional regulator, chromosome partitioning protein